MGFGEIEITSVLASARIADALPLDELERIDKLANRAERHAAFLGVRLGPTKRFVAIRSNGRVEARGAKSLDEALSLIEQIRAMLLPAFSTYPATDFRVSNIVSRADFGESIHLTALVQSLDPGEGEYEPEQFPALILSLPSGNARALVFSSGKCVVTGVKSLEELRKCYDILAQRLRRISPGHDTE